MKGMALFCLRGRRHVSHELTEVHDVGCSEVQMPWCRRAWENRTGVQDRYELHGTDLDKVDGIEAIAFEDTPPPRIPPRVPHSPDTVPSSQFERED
jgi:hypothetical protein